MTFSDRVRTRYRASIVAFCAGLCVAEALVWVLMTFVVFVALSASGVVLALDMRRMILIIVQISVLMTAFCMWIARGIQLSADVNALISNASDLQKKLLGVQLVEEAGMPTEDVDRLIEREQVEVVDITGSPATTP